MPRIKLKHKSPDFAENPQDFAPKAHMCDAPGCIAAGTFRAPKDRGLKEYYNFCLEHVQEYNKSWDFFNGMSEDQVQEHVFQSLYGDRPTWRYDIDSRIDDILHRKIHEFREGLDRKDNDSRRKGPRTPAGPISPEYAAMEVLGLSPPFTLADVKARHKELVRLHHPDRNAGNRESEDILKAVNAAYTILLAACERSGA